jgi:hypothetical protein
VLDSSSCDVFSGTGPSRAVRSVDFPAAGRRGTGCAEPAAPIAPGFRYLWVKPAAAHPGQRLSGDAYAGRDGLQPDPVRAVRGCRAADRIVPPPGWKRLTAIMSSGYAGLPGSGCVAGGHSELTGRRTLSGVSSAGFIALRFPLGKTVLDLA